MLLGNRFLTGKDVAMLLKHYEGLVKMDSWYPDDPDDKDKGKDQPQNPNIAKQ